VGERIYNQIVTRAFLLGCFLSGALFAQQPPPDSKKKPLPDKQESKEKESNKEDDPPEEDASLKPRVYSFNPLASNKSILAGNYYFKKGNLAAARDRYDEATKYNPGSAEAYLKLGETFEKLRDKRQARAAYEKYIELAQDPKGTDAIKKKIEKWPK
jgi:tetratricopeptide (TPR) repeat protein